MVDHRLAEEALRKEELRLRRPVEYLPFSLTEALADRFFGKGVWEYQELLDYALGLAGGASKVLTVLEHRKCLIDYNTSLLPLLKPTGMVKNPDPVPEEYPLPSLKRDMALVAAEMLPGQILEVSFREQNPPGVRLFRVEGQPGIVREVALH